MSSLFGARCFCYDDIDYNNIIIKYDECIILWPYEFPVCDMDILPLGMQHANISTLWCQPQSKDLHTGFR